MEAHGIGAADPRTAGPPADAARSYDPNVVIRAADDRLAVNDVAGGQTLFQSALLNWVDDAQFAGSSGGGGGEDDAPARLREAIATLWIAYARYLHKARQNKSATEAYEQAVHDPVAGRTGRIWLDYARFLVEKGMLKKAQDVYLRALVGGTGDGDDADGNYGDAVEGGRVTDEQDRDLLWSDFLEMMQVTKPELTIAKLKEAIAKEHGSSRTQAAPDSVPSRAAMAGGLDGGEGTDDDMMYDDLEPSSKRPRLGDGTRIKQESDAELTSMAMDTESSRRHVVTAPDVKVEEAALLDITENVTNDPQFMATWMVRDGDHPPQAPEPPLFAAAPPKLSDPTGKDLLGEDLALQLVKRLLGPTGSVILQVCRGLWMLTGLKEEQSRKKLLTLDESIKEEYQSLKHRLDQRLSVSGAAEAAVRTMNETERLTFEANCNGQRRKVLNDIAWGFRQVLWIQQQFLTKLHIPGFAGPTVDAFELEYQARVCSYLHSAFFLRQRIGEEAHMKMLQSQQARLIKLQEDATMTMGTFRSSTPPPASRRKPSRFSPNLSSATARFSPPPMGRTSPVPHPQQQQQQQQQQHPVMMGGQYPMQQFPQPMYLQQPPLPLMPPAGGYMPPPQMLPQYGTGMAGYPIPPPPLQQQHQQVPPMMMPPGYAPPHPQLHQQPPPPPQQSNPPYYQ